MFADDDDDDDAASRMRTVALRSTAGRRTRFVALSGSASGSCAAFMLTDSVRK